MRRIDPFSAGWQASPPWHPGVDHLLSALKWASGKVTALAKLLAVGTACFPLASAGAEADEAFFERKVRPLLAEHCVSCHGAEKQKGHLRLDSPEAIRAGGDGGAIFVAGDPEKSRMIRAVRYLDEDLRMPPKQRLTEPQVQDLVRWIKEGGTMPAADPSATSPAPRKEFQIAERDRQHWAFQPIRRLPLPRLENQPQHPIDAWIGASLQSRGLAPNPTASRRELIRRAAFDLTGLPPSPEEVEAFVKDPSPKAWESLIDRLLDSPHYGEKWGRHWLDLVRFAESNSYERDGAKPHAWRYRDYVIRSLNSDKPYDRFLKEQLAGDELPEADADAIIATGFYRLGIWDDEPADRELARYDALDDIVTTTGQTFLGLTVDCARCHHHKIDPISQNDYYRLVSFFQNINHYRNGGPTDEVPVFNTAAEKTAHERKQRELESRRNQRQREVTELEDRFLAKRRQSQQTLSASTSAGVAKPPSAGELASLLKSEGQAVLGGEEWSHYQKAKADLEQLKQITLPVDLALSVTEAGSTPPETFVLLRGNPNMKGDKVEPGFLQVLGASQPLKIAPTTQQRTSGRRTLLADWIASPANPLTARVMVNRLWQHHFGRGIVRSPNNFGLQGDRPTHPELLDWLASQFIEGGWRLKAMHRLIMTSQAYQRSSAGQQEGLAKDPANNSFWRFDMRRLTAEEIRDSILSITGVLNPKMYGPGVYVDIPKEVLAGQSQPGSGWGKSPADEQSRRSVYIHVKRSLMTPILESFDVAETDRSAPVRFATVQPTQALGMLNGAFLNQQAVVLASRLKRECKDDPAAQVRRAISLATSRLPAQPEIDRSLALMRSLEREDGASPDVALRYFCVLVLNLNEMVFLD